ncbi:Threonine synthase [Anaerobiospirillum thomasii]|uniref:Threonine synthase n=1 Tax=Anaerobiospirillum thomasii TaxID=179995 RepID=A0A2X0WWW3_9GAMM|nr:threonine synthase [Anaerobiospirillum thomasii]SPT70011.1 Threonine synthase [Anaerobiospirillum thomasii]SPT71348.1 Threonine synthase [Anaerobiospirillum thomasii]
MQLFNLKDKSQEVNFATAVTLGIGRNQGLFFVDRIIKLDNIDELLSMPLVARSQKILRHIIGDEVPELEAIVEDAFTFKAPLVKADDNIFALELFHGPTLAFKDFGARFMARVLSAIRGDKHLTILTATSGDTGAAVADAFYRQKGIDVVILYPKGKISILQEKLISTLGENINAIEVEGDFDMCQDMVKKAFDDRDFVDAVGLNSANSINVSRLFAQICYYFEAVAQLPESKRDKVVFSVPCGNFGNITAGLIARALGLKARFVIACNVNDTVPRYLKSGRWEPKPTIATLSNAMDISRPNNWPRVEALCQMQNWSLQDFDYGVLDDESTKGVMRDLYSRTSYILEPHAAIAYSVLKDALSDDETGIFLGTAHPAKFKDDVDSALGIDVPVPEILRSKMELENKSVVMKPDFELLKDYMLNTLKLDKK